MLRKELEIGNTLVLATFENLPSERVQPVHVVLKGFGMCWISPSAQHHSITSSFLLWGAMER